MNKFQILKDEIDNDPLGRGYAGTSDQDIANSLNSKDHDNLVALSSTELRIWAAESARAFNIREAISDGTKVDQVRNLSLILDKLLGTDDGVLDPSIAAHVAMINQLVLAGVLADSDRTALVAAATQLISRAKQLGLPLAKVGHIQIARA